MHALSSNTKEDAAKLKWDGVKCLFEDAQSDILLLLDTCAIRDAPPSGSHGVKQGIAACSYEPNWRDPNARSFTALLSEALLKLSGGRPFTLQRLYDEIHGQHQVVMQQQARLANGASKAPTPEKFPFLFTLYPGKGQGLILAPLTAKNKSSLDGETESKAQALTGASVEDLTMDEARVLVCTTFVGDASPDMSSFTQWLANTPPGASKITVEGMFIGPPTMLLISMPQNVWNVVQHDKVCCFLGFITTHNMIHLYQNLVRSSAKATPKEVEDGRILLEASKAATAPSMRYDEPPRRAPLPSDAPSRSTALGSQTDASLQFITYTPRKGGEKEDEVEDSAEMQEAAEQLKALSHLRHHSDDMRGGTMQQSGRGHDASADGNHQGHEDDDPSDDANGSGADDSQYNASQGGTIRVATGPISSSSPNPGRDNKALRRSLSKQFIRQETRCTLCTHAPFKDSSSLRKHIAAAHTRPFPCAFSFAGCISTFGSKNEWKRHIASQHLCLTYYRCSSCPMQAAPNGGDNTAMGRGNEFNRKDLFTQHLRRMHAPFSIKKATAKGDPRLQAEWEAHVKEMQQSCLINRRQPPQRSACPKPDCQSLFEGPGSWDEWTEHVGRHMEKGEGGRLGVDSHLAKWALDEGIIERKEDGKYRLTNQGGGGGSDESPPAPQQATPTKREHHHYNEAVSAADKLQHRGEKRARDDDSVVAGGGSGGGGPSGSSPPPPPIKTDSSAESDERAARLGALDPAIVKDAIRAVRPGRRRLTGGMDESSGASDDKNADAESSGGAAAVSDEPGVVQTEEEPAVTAEGGSAEDESTLGRRRTTRVRLPSRERQWVPSGSRRKLRNSTKRGSTHLGHATTAAAALAAVALGERSSSGGGSAANEEEDDVIEDEVVVLGDEFTAGAAADDHERHDEMEKGEEAAPVKDEKSTADTGVDADRKVLSDVTGGGDEAAVADTVIVADKMEVDG